MGALTLKSFPFELRGWDIEKFESIDPTDGFGSNTRIYINKSKIVLIEPDYNTNTFNAWLTDKGRQFFDGIFASIKNKKIKSSFWCDLFKTINKTIYILDHCNQLNYKKKFVTIIFENLSLEVLNILIFISQKYSFIKLKRAENFTFKNDLECNFQLNTTVSNTKLSSSSICLLISSNPRYEGFCLNLNLRQRFLKGNFTCFILGSFVDLTFPTVFLGSNIKILRSISEGNNVNCQEFKRAKTPIIVYNEELFKRVDNKTILNMLKTFNYSSKFNRAWNGLNMLNSSLSENGNNTLCKFIPVSLKDLNNSSFLYFINVISSNSANLKIITELNLLNYSNQSITKSFQNLIIDQNYRKNVNCNFNNKINLNNNFNCYTHIPTSIFYENEETFLNTEGFFKRTIKLISEKKTKNSWKILKKFLKNLNKNFIFFNNKNNELIIFNSKKIINFKNFTNFHFYATKNLTNLNFYLTIKTEPIIFYSKYKKFKSINSKFRITRLKYWLDDFFTLGKDEYSQNSFVLANCSKILRSESTNFF